MERQKCLTLEREQNHSSSSVRNNWDKEVEAVWKQKQIRSFEMLILSFGKKGIQREGKQTFFLSGKLADTSSWKVYKDAVGT